jgi:hypothetical protein
VKGKIEERGLTLHPEKTRIVDATEDDTHIRRKHAVHNSRH